MADIRIGDEVRALVDGLEWLEWPPPYAGVKARTGEVVDITEINGTTWYEVSIPGCPVAMFQRDDLEAVA